MSAQLTYSIAQGIAYAGAIYALANKEISSRVIETVAGANFGIAVSRGTDKDLQVVIGGTDFLGLTVRSLERESDGSANDVKYFEKDAAGIMRNGTIWAICPTGCVPGDPVNYVNATGVLDSGAAIAGETLLNGAVWDSTASAGALALIRLETSGTTAGS